ncbi:CDP-glycerol glycerophosphotransferase family protein, partial [Campylobacter coli]
DGTSTLDNSYTKEYFLTTIDIGTLSLLECFYFNRNIQNVCLYHIIWQIKDLINSPEKLSFMSENEKQRYLELLDQNFSYIDTETILDFNLAGCWFFHKVGILNCFKIEKPPFQIAYIEDYDPYKEQILITYYTGDDKDIESILVDEEEVYVDYKKIVKYDFLDRVFCYQKRLWVHIPKNAKDKLEMFINDEQSMIGKYDEYFLNIKNIRQEFQKRLPKSNIWLLMDRDYEADDNAEHLYRYIMQNHPEQEIVFALRKESSDWERLKKEGFNLVEFGSFEFERIIKKASKVISSHSDGYLTRYITPRQQFIFLQHGVTKDDLSRWLNQRKIDTFITSTKAEYESIAGDFNHYKFSTKEVVLTGFARHDALLKNNQCNARQIIIMPTWRKNIVNSVVANSGKRKLNLDFKQTMYFKKYNSLINNNLLKKVCQEYGYTIVFNPHPNIMPYLKEFNFPSYIKIANQNESLQELFCNSSLMITDYSSVAFEMAYLNKPVIYYQFDHEEFFNSHTYQKGYFDYKKDGFGPVVEDEESLLKDLENLLQNDCNPCGIYKDNIDSTFAFKDGKCCERIYQEILKLDEPYQNEISLDYVKQKAQGALKYECYLEAMRCFQYLLENSENFDEEIAKNCLEVAMEVEKGYEIAKILLEKDCQEMSRELKFLMIKNILSNKKASKEEVEQCLEVLETMETPQGKEKEFLLSKLRIYFYLANRKRINEIIEELQTKHGVSKEDIHFEMLFALNCHLLQ